MFLNTLKPQRNSSQCAFVADAVKDIFAKEAKERQVRTAENREKADNPVPQIFGEQEEPENQHATKANTQAAKAVGNTNAEYV